MKGLVWVIFVLACFLAVAGYHKALGAEYSCAQVRSYVAQVGIAQAQASGQAQGMTAQQQAAARACLGGGKKRRTHR
jgi:hypothetical protein